ncbi:MAG TPA: hypothetical protein VM925_09760 [Labilithrix sp.]|nr:hypothetical protein [Labilithrix sp.]
MQVSTALLGGILLLSLGCSKDETSAAPTGTTDAGNVGDASSAEISADGGLGVECTHPGAGKPLGNDRCECASTRNIAGEWTTLRTCREGDVCPTKNKEETVVITQDGTSVRIDRGDTYSVSGKLCGDFVVWSGGPKDGLNPECGQLRLVDDSHYVTDSCFAASGECSRTHAQGCPSQKGQCTGTGSKKPDPPATIQKVICN